MNKSPQQQADPSPSRTPHQNSTNPSLFPFRYLLRDSADQNSVQSPLQNTDPENDIASKSPVKEVLTNCELVQMKRSPENLAVAKIAGGGVESGVLRISGTKNAELGLRVSEAIFCMISFSVMAADKTAGWAGDSFDRYMEFRYCVAINVIGFVYSVFQIYAQFHGRMKRRGIVDRQLSYYLDFFMDQALAYLLMSASSSAAARNDEWISMFGNDKFTDMIKGSIAMSFLAFFAFALSSIISAEKLFSWNL